MAPMDREVAAAQAGSARSPAPRSRAKSSQKIEHDMLNPTLAMRGMVACPHALASRRASTCCAPAARRSMRRSPPRAALGGRLPAHVRHRRRRFLADLRRRARARSRYLDGGGRAAAAATLERFAGQTRNSVPRPRARRRSPRPAQWRASARRTRATAGCRSRAACEDAIHYARDGYPGHRAPRALDRADRGRSSRRIRPRPRCSCRRQRRDRARRNPALRDTLEAIASAGRAGFYEGEVAANSALARSTAASSPQRDLAAQRAHWGEPIRGTYRGVTIYETPPPTQGFTVLEMLNLIEPLELRAALPRARSRAPAGAGEADRLPRSRPLARRSALRRCRSSACSRRPTPTSAGADRSRARAAVGQGALRRQPGRRHRLRRRGRRAKATRPR